MSTNDAGVIWPYEMKDLDVLQTALQAVYENREADMLYVHFDRAEVRCEDQRVGYFVTLDDTVVFKLDRSDGPVT